MAKDETTTEEALKDEPEVSEPEALEMRAEDEAVETAPAQLGSTRYVHSAFVCVGILTAYVSGQVLAGVWNALAAWPAAVRAVPQLLRYGEDERPAYTLVAGAMIGLVLLVRLFRDEGIRKWSDDVALELSKVVWPTREIVTNGTIVVIVASLLATVYVGLLDRLWGFVTTLVYGA